MMSQAVDRRGTVGQGWGEGPCLAAGELARGPDGRHLWAAGCEHGTCSPWGCDKPGDSQSLGTCMAGMGHKREEPVSVPPDPPSTVHGWERVRAKASDILPKVPAFVFLSNLSRSLPLRDLFAMSIMVQLYY